MTEYVRLSLKQPEADDFVGPCASFLRGRGITPEGSRVELEYVKYNVAQVVASVASYVVSEAEHDYWLMEDYSSEKRFSAPDLAKGLHAISVMRLVRAEAAVGDIVIVPRRADRCLANEAHSSGLSVISDTSRYPNTFSEFAATRFHCADHPVLMGIDGTALKTIACAAANTLRMGSIDIERRAGFFDRIPVRNDRGATALLSNVSDILNDQFGAVGYLP
jgi:hypothetical protein